MFKRILSEIEQKHAKTARDLFLQVTIQMISQKQHVMCPHLLMSEPRPTAVVGFEISITLDPDPQFVTQLEIPVMLVT